MKHEVHVLLRDLKACTNKRDLRWGRSLHAIAINSLNDSDAYVATALIKMYAKSGSMVEARQVFDDVQNPDVVTWTALLLGYADCGEGHLCLDLFSKLETQGCIPDNITYIAALKACTSLAVNGDFSKRKDCLEWGKNIHSKIKNHSNPYLHNALIDMYAKCGSMIDAHHVFESMEKAEVVSWTILIQGYADNDEGLVAIDVFNKMKASGCVPNTVTYIAALKACTSFPSDRDDGSKKYFLERGREMHSQLRPYLDQYLQNTLIAMYATCGSMVESQLVFESMQRPNVVSWTSLLLGYAENGDGEVALNLFTKMKTSGCAPDSFTYVAALKACTNLAMNGDSNAKRYCLVRGRNIHSEIAHLCYYVQTALIEMYSKCGSMVDAFRVFNTMLNPDVLAWNALLLGYADIGEGHTTLELFASMKSRGCVPDFVTYVAVLKACSSLASSGEKEESLMHGRKVHLEIHSRLNLNVQNALINLYSKCSCMLDARSVFDQIENPDVVSWSTLVLGYAENGEADTALDLFGKMTAFGCIPNNVTYVGALKACGFIGALPLGRKIHAEIREFNTLVVTCLVDFYAKCGSIVEAREVFNLHSTSRDVRTWTALLAGYSSIGDSSSTFELFGSMQAERIQPDAVTFVSLFLCCNHAGLVENAWEYFDTMVIQYGIIPGIMHYNCMVDVLGRANQLKDAIALIQKMPCNPDPVTWLTLLGACLKWKKVEIGRLAFQALSDLKKKNASFVLMARMYRSWDILADDKVKLGNKQHGCPLRDQCKYLEHARKSRNVASRVQKSLKTVLTPFSKCY